MLTWRITNIPRAPEMKGRKKKKGEREGRKEGKKHLKLSREHGTHSAWCSARSQAWADAHSSGQERLKETQRKKSSGVLSRPPEQSNL